MRKIYHLIIVSAIGLIVTTACTENNANHHFRNGSAKLQLKDYQGAILDLNKAIELNPNYREAYYARAVSYGILGKPDQAGVDFDKVIQLDPTYKDAYLNRAFYVREKTGDYTGALQDYNTFLNLNKDGNKAFALNNRGFVKFKMDDPQGALADIQSSIALDSTNSYAYKNRALIYISIDSIPLACQDLNKANELGYSKTYDKEVEDLLSKYCAAN